MNEDLEILLKHYGSTIETVERLYPNLFEPTMNLSATGVSARTYFYWKKSGLVGIDNKKEEKEWVKINLIEYVWIKLIVTMREFGVPFKKIKEVKELLFENWINEILKDKEEFYAEIRKNDSNSKFKIDQLEKLIEASKDELDNSLEEFEIYYTLIASLILELLIKNDNGYIVLSKKENEFQFDYFNLKSFDDYKEYIAPLFDVPCLHIPIRSLLVDFLEDDKNDKHIHTISLLNFKEQKVIEAIRERKFKEIVIKPDNSKESIIIEIEKDGNILDEKAKEVKRILGLNEYSEVTVKFRNDKNLYFTNKTRL